MGKPAKYELIAHPWPPLEESWWLCFWVDTDIGYAIKVYTERMGKLPEYVVLTTKRWYRETGATEPDSAYYVYKGVKVTWHPESLGLLRLGPKGER